MVWYLCRKQSSHHGTQLRQLSFTVQVRPKCQNVCSQILALAHQFLSGLESVFHIAGSRRSTKHSWTVSIHEVFCVKNKQPGSQQVRIPGCFHSRPSYQNVHITLVAGSSPFWKKNIKKCLFESYSFCLFFPNSLMHRIINPAIIGKIINNPFHSNKRTK